MPLSKDWIVTDHPEPGSARIWRNRALVGVAVLSTLSVVAATATAPGSVDSPVPIVAVHEILPPPAFDTLAAPDLPYVKQEQVRSGDTISSLFSRLGIDDRSALNHLLASDQGKEAARLLRAGRSVSALVGGDGSLHSFTLPMGNSSSRLTLSSEGENTFSIAVTDAPTETVVEMRSGVIQHSLFGATDSAGLPDAIAMRLADLFGTEINFNADIRKGDRFSVVYEASLENGVATGSGKVLAAEFVNNGKRHLVALHRNADGREDFYSFDGRALRQGFLRYPLEFSRISSTFGRRLHPIHRSWRSHNGVDFAAPTGTPVKAATDGTIDFVGTQRGYGNIVILRHRNQFSTAYAHLNGFASGMRKGQRVSQGDVIGFVGMTGWATGPHLHYEIRINNKPHDPMSIALPTVEPLLGKNLAMFRENTMPWFQRIAMLTNEPLSLESPLAAR